MNLNEMLKDCRDTWQHQATLEIKISKYFQEHIPEQMAYFVDCEVNKTYLRVKLHRNVRYNKPFLKALIDIESEFSLVDDGTFIIMDFIY